MTVIFILILVGLATLGIAIGNPVASNVAASSTGTVETNANPGHYSNGSLTGSEITNDPSTWPGVQSGFSNGSIWDIVTAVALAEGYNQGSGVAPYDLNNPGDLSPGDEQGQAVAGPPENHDGSEIIDFSTAEGGFIALYIKFFNIASGNSKVYPKTLTWTQVAAIYAGDSGNWVKNVTNYLGVNPSSTPAQYAGLA